MKNISLSKFYFKDFVAIALYLTTFINISTSFFPYYNNIRVVLLIFLIIYMLSKIKVFVHYKYIFIFSVLTLFGCVVLLSVLPVRNYNPGRSLLPYTIYFLADIFVFFVLIIYFAEIKFLRRVLNIFLYLTIIFILINDYFCFVRSDRIYLLGSEFGNDYGNKFTIVYFHLFFLMLFSIYMLSRPMAIRNFVAFICIVLFCFVISVKVNCMTGILGLFIYILSFVILNRFKRIHPIFYLTVLLLSCSFVWIYKIVLENQFLQHLVVEYFNRSLTLSGRTIIYTMLPDILSKHLFLGYGYGMGYTVMSEFGWPDTQNGLIEWVLYSGIFAPILICIIVYYIFNYIYRTQINDICLKCIISLIVTFSILSAIEITIDNLFFGLSFLLFASAIYKQKEIQ